MRCLPKASALISTSPPKLRPGFHLLLAYGR